MKYWTEYFGHELKVYGKRKLYDNNIYTFDIETTSFLILNDKQLETKEYLNLTKKQQEECKFQSTMYIWMFGINEDVYYGRTYEELYKFLKRIEYYTLSYNIKKIVYVHNLSWEFQFLRNIFKFKNVMARKSHKVMRCDLENFNYEFRCSLYMTNVKLEKIPKIYKLDVEKLVGNLDYNKIRHFKTKLTKKELKYCENDCLVVYKYILKELELYEKTKQTPLTSTGHVRKELKDLINKNWDYKNKVRKAINTNGHIYNLLLEAFAGGYTHANWIFANEVIKNVSSFDFTSSYPYVMVTEKFPMTEFKKCSIIKETDMVDEFAYLLVVQFKNLKCKYYNNFISQNKVLRIKNGRYDNGRIISADEIEIVLTDVDLKFLLKSYTGTYKILESYYSIKEYLPQELINFILEKYIFKTKYKNVKEKEIEYNLEKAKFNSIYGMCVTNNIKDKVIFENETGWREEEISNEEILESLQKEKKKSFLNFAWGVWVTAYARINLLENVLKLDDYVIYCDTDSLKLREGFNKKIIEKYNERVLEKIKKASNELKIDINKFMPEDCKGKKRMLGIFEHDIDYKEFITQGAKKYAYRDKKYGEIHITVSGVPKSGSKTLKNLEDFKDDFVFDFKDTGKNLLIYNDEMMEFELTDYYGKKEKITDKYGCILVPTTYILGKSDEYAELISDESSKRAVFKE